MRNSASAFTMWLGLTIMVALSMHVDARLLGNNRNIASTVAPSSEATISTSIMHDKFRMAASPELAIDGQYIVQFNDQVSHVESKVQNLLAFLQSLFGQNALQTLFTYSSAFKGFAVRGVVGGILESILDDSDVALVEQDARVNTTFDQSNPVWNLDRLDEYQLPLDNQYKYDYTGQGVAIYILDSGVRLSHNEFNGRATCGYNAVSAESCDDQVGHGTHVAGIAAGSTYGVAKDATIVSVKVLDASGGGDYSALIAGLDYVVQQKQANPSQSMVANLSLGGPIDSLLDQAVSNTVDAGVVVVVAAGNSNQDACSYSPAATSAAITVGATTNQDERASYSNYGPCVDLFAPGDNVKSSWSSSDSSTYTLSGTSMASPHVAGVAAQYLEAHPDWTASQISQAIVSDGSLNQISNAGSGSPNVLLYSGSVGTSTGGSSNNNNNPRTDPPTACKNVMNLCQSHADCCSDNCFLGLCFFF